MKTLVEMSREIYGHNGRAINRHSERIYRDARGQRYVLSKTLDGFPPFFEAYGPFKAKHNGVLPRLCVQGKEYWGDGWTWRAAVQAFCQQLRATIAAVEREMQPKHAQ